MNIMQFQDSLVSIVCMYLFPHHKFFFKLEWQCYRLHNKINKREAELKENIPLHQRWQKSPIQDPKWFLILLGSP